MTISLYLYIDVSRLNKVTKSDFLKKISGGLLTSVVVYYIRRLNKIGKAKYKILLHGNTFLLDMIKHYTTHYEWHYNKNPNYCSCMFISIILLIMHLPVSAKKLVRSLLTNFTLALACTDTKFEGAA